MDTNFAQDRQQTTEFAMSNQGLASDQRQVERAMLPD
jgi:hypothetical protein